MNLDDFLTTPVSSDALIKLALVGASGAGKTTAAATFPNAQFWDFENNFPTALIEKGVKRIPFYDPAWREELVKLLGGSPASQSYAKKHASVFLGKYIQGAQTSLTPADTVVIDSITQLGESVKVYCKEMFSDDIDKNGYALWGHFADEMQAIFEMFKTLNCNVVALFHEDQIRDSEKNTLLARRWIMDGKKFTPRVPGFFNNLFRQVREVKGNVNTMLKHKVDTKTEVEYEYLWQIASADKFEDAKTTIKTKKLYVPATYESFQL